MRRDDGQSALGRLFGDYGMVLVLVLLAALFSFLTLKQQHPTGAAAGRQVAERVLAQYGTDAGVLIVTRNTPGDREFSDEANAVLVERNIHATVVNGEPADVRKAIELSLSENRSIDAIIANDVTAKWSVFDRYPEVGSGKCATPESYVWPDFLKSGNLLGVANQTAIYAIIAIGMTMVIVCGQIDLSVGSLVALAAIAATLFVRDVGSGAESSAGVVAVACLVAVLLCALVGSIVGALVARVGIPSFIATLAVMSMASGLAFRLSEAQSIADLPESFFWLGGARTAGVPNPVWLMVGLYIVAHVVMSRTAFGRYIYAIGGNVEAARLSGVPVKRVLMVVFTICAGLAGLGGVIQASQLAAGDPKFGAMYELEVIAAVVVGGTSLMGGQGKILGTLIGAFIIAVIKNGMNLTNVDPFNQKIVLGAVLLFAVWLDTMKRNRGW